VNINRIQLISNNTLKSQKAEETVKQHVEHFGMEIVDDNPDLIIAIGGDGAFIQAVHKTDFNKDVYYVGIHTGHLGFLQEVNVDNINRMIEMIHHKNYRIDKVSVEAVTVYTESRQDKFLSLNEVTVREKDLRTMYFDVLVNNRCLERFAGDGINISTSLGSTAYNLSLGGSIMYQEMNCLQLMPIAPINSSAYKSLRCGVIVPENMVVSIIPNEGYEDKVLISVDGMKREYDEKVQKIETTTSVSGINILRFDQYDFWTRVNEKLL